MEQKSKNPCKSTKSTGDCPLTQSLGDKLRAAQKRVADETLASAKQAHTGGLTEEELGQRLDALSWYRGRRTFVRTKGGKDLGEFRFEALADNGFYLMVHTKSGRREVFDPKSVEVESRAERTLRFTEERLGRLDAEMKRLDGQLKRARAEIARERRRASLRRFVTKKGGCE